MTTAKNGRGPNGRALNKDGSERKERTKLTPLQKHQKAQAEARAADRSLGRDAVNSVDSLANFRAGISTVRGYLRQAAEYATPEKVADRIAYHQAQIDSAQDKGVAAASYLAEAGDTVSGLENFEANVGADIMAFMDDNLREPDSVEMEKIVHEHISEDVVDFVSEASGPDADPFAKFRRNADTEDGEDTDTLD